MWLLDSRGSQGVQPFDISAPHKKKSCLGPHIILWHIITQKKSHNVLSKFMILHWAAFTAILGCMWPVGRRLDTPDSEAVHVIWLRRAIAQKNWNLSWSADGSTKTLCVICDISLSLTPHPWLANAVGTSFKIYPQSNHFSFSALTLLWSHHHHVSYRATVETKLTTLLLSLSPAISFPSWFSWKCLTLTDNFYWVVASQKENVKYMSC